jgi:hypothetical protein
MHGERTSLPVAAYAAAGATLGLEPMCRLGDVRGAASEPLANLLSDVIDETVNALGTGTGGTGIARAEPGLAED